MLTKSFSINGLNVKKAIFLLLLPGVAALLSSSSALSDELVYKPVNPAFGGAPFNGPHLLATANAQKPNAPQRKRPSAIEQFGENVERAVISQTSRNIAEQILGENAKESGSFTVGDTNLDFHREGGQVVINISDSAKGDSTTIKVPVPQ